MNKIYGIIVVSSTRIPANGMNKVVFVANEHLVENGVTVANVQSNGYGESLPINHCVKEGIC